MIFFYCERGTGGRSESDTRGWRVVADASVVRVGVEAPADLSETPGCFVFTRVISHHPQCEEAVDTRNHINNWSGGGRLPSI